FTNGEPIGPLLAAVARQFRLPDEAGHAIADRHLDTGIGNPSYGSGDDLALLELPHTGFERVRAELLDAKADALLLDIDVEHLDADFLAGRDDLSGVHILFGPTHLGDVDQPFDAGFQLDKGAVVGDVRDPAAELGAGRIYEIHTFPRIGFELFHAERDALGLGIEANDLDLDGLTDGQRLRWMIDAAPGDVGDMEQPVDTTKVDEGAVIGDV